MSIIDEADLEWLTAMLAGELKIYELIKDHPLMGESTRERIKRIEDRIQELEKD